MRLSLALAAMALMFSAACGKQPGSYEVAATGEKGAATGVLEEARELWGQRVDEAKLQAALAKYEEAATADPSNREAYLHLTRGWYFWGDAFTTDKDVQIERWLKAIEWGKKCMALNDAFKARIDANEKERDAVVAATADDAGCLYWLATSLGKWGKASGIAKTLKHLPTVKAYTSKVEELDPQHFNYGPARYWGAYYSVIPSFAGQDFDKSSNYFEASIKGAPYYLGTRVLRAEFWAVGTQNAKAFKEDLEFVINADPNEVPEVAPENMKEQQKAKKLLEEMSQLFDKKAMEALSSNEG